MSCDIILFNSRQEIHSVDEVNETELDPTDLCTVFESHFKSNKKDGKH